LGHDVLPFSTLALDFSLLNLEPPAKSLSGTLPATAGALIFPQSPHPRNRQIGWPEASYSEGADSKIPQRQTISFVSSLKQHKNQRSCLDVTPSHSFACAGLRAIPAKHFHGQGDETKIIALENLWNQMQINHDADAMGKLLDSDFVLTDYDGSVLNKGQFLASIRDKSTQLTVEVSDDMKLHRHGDTVVVTGATHEKGTEKGKPFSHVGRFTDTWIKKDGQWLCVASQLSLIGK